MLGARNSDSSREYASWPARKCSNTVENPFASLPAKIGTPSLSRSERWMWHEFPSRSLYFAMKVRLQPSCDAISLDPNLKSPCSSHLSTNSANLKACLLYTSDAAD